MGAIEHNIRIAGAGSELQGVGRAADGRALFAFGALPGELVDVNISRDGGRFLVGEAVRIIEPASGRIEPPCPDYGRCGGCAAQHMNYQLSLDLKTQKVKNAFERIGKIDRPDVRDTIGSADSWRYRNKAEYGCIGGAMGTTARGSRRVIDVGDCLLQREASIALLGAARELLANEKALSGLVTRVNGAGELMGILCIRHGSKIGDMQGIVGALAQRVPALTSLYTCQLAPKPNHALDGPVKHIFGAERLSERLCGLDFVLSPHTFFQVNGPQAEVLVDQLLTGLNLRGDELVVDLYCGIGTLTLPLARAAKRIYGVEIVAPAIEDARLAAAANGIENAEFRCGDAVVELGRILKSGVRPNAIVVDPPRKGLDPKLIERILTCAPEQIGYVSCDCATLARDVKQLTESGKYALNHIQPVDMFPWTEHVETVVLMSRVGAVKV